MICPRRTAPYAGGAHFVGGIPLRVVLPLVAINSCADQREDHPEGGIPPTKWAPHAQWARPAGQDYFSLTMK
jgi:hypothetical protein